MNFSAGAACAAPGVFARVPGAARVAAIPVPPDAVTETKAYLRIETEAEEMLVGRLVAAAIGHCEAFTGQLLIARAVTERVAAAHEWRPLTHRPVKTITGVAGQTGIAPPVPLAVDGYAMDVDAGGDGWVRAAGPVGGMRLHVDYVAGMAAGWDDLPEPIRQGVIRLASHLYSHRDAADEGNPPAAVAALWRPWRRMRLA